MEILFLIYSANLYLLLELCNLFTFNTMIDKVWLISAFLLFVFYVYCVSSVCVSSYLSISFDIPVVRAFGGGDSTEHLDQVHGVDTEWTFRDATSSIYKTKLELQGFLSFLNFS